jgi:hypothetical protein
MADASKIETFSVEEGFPAPTIPTIFCDGILNLAPSAQVVRFYLFRSDPDQTGKLKFKNHILAQIIMPIPAFIHTALFFERGLKQFAEQGTISPDMIDKIKQVTQAELTKQTS